MNCSQLENFLLEYNFMPQNPATLIWVQVTQIFKKEEKRFKLHFRKRATKVSTALRCFFLFCFVFHHCGPWLLCQEPDIYFRQTDNKSTQPVSCGEALSLPSPAISILNTSLESSILN